ncbi:MAG: glycosyltransferase family 2 protein [Nitratireductor sp.]|nr:glycosyltransferase family 2 protein [Nitratireductor sp.]
MSKTFGKAVVHDFGGTHSWPVAVTIPARNEARRLLACLNTTSASLRGRGGIVVAVNGSTDETFALAEAWFRATGSSGILINEAEPPQGSGVGRARRLAIAACERRLADGAVVMTSDADSCVAGDWVDANFAELNGADLICGTVQPDPEEFAQLPATIGRRGAIEGEYMALTIAARTLLDPVPHDPAPTHLNAAGASLAFRMGLYHDVGGIPDLQLGEDRAFVAIAEKRGWRIRHSARAQVNTACRLRGRTSGGMAGALRARITEPDPLVDELLEPSRQTLLRARLRGALRKRCADSAGFEQEWKEVEKRPDLQRVRLRLSDLTRELPFLTAAVAGLTSLPERRSA